MAKRYISRDIEKVLKLAVKQFPSVIVTGPRQSGKTTLLRRLFSKSHRYVSMDNPDLRLMAAKEPMLFLENYPPPVVIDEIQYAPELFPYIKILIDKNRSLKGQFLLTGSQIFPLMAKVGESLAGRIGILHLLSFSLREQLGLTTPLSINRLKKRVLTGGFPEVAFARNINVELWFAGYLQTYLERDVRQLRQVGDLGDFQRFLQLTAALNGQVLNLSNLSRDLGVAVNTVKAWFSILEASGQIILVKPFYLNRGKRIIKSPKIYFLDTGLLCYLMGINSINQVFKGPFSGQLFETVILGEIIRSFYNQGKLPRLFWWRTSSGGEIDFIIEAQGKIRPVEVKLSSKINKVMAQELVSFCRLFSDKVDKGFVVNLVQERFQLDKKISFTPVRDFIQYLYSKSLAGIPTSVKR